MVFLMVPNHFLFLFGKFSKTVQFSKSKEADYLHSNILIAKFCIILFYVTQIVALKDCLILFLSFFNNIVYFFFLFLFLKDNFYISQKISIVQLANFFEKLFFMLKIKFLIEVIY